MYVRWKKQKRHKKESGYYFFADGFNTHPQHIHKEADLLTAYLVESTRVDGQPKQKIITYLGSIKSTHITNLGGNAEFWKSVDTHLRSVKLKTDQRKEIEQMLQKRIPKVSEKVLYKIATIEHFHPRHRGAQGKAELEAFRARYNLPGDDMRPSVVPTTS